jgi:EAL domain-containing protein (putative c-di-GMP-specific phosphodiesterase class I)
MSIILILTIVFFVVAEYVENNEIKQKLTTINVNYVQGYGIGKPEPLENLLM